MWRASADELLACYRELMYMSSITDGVVRKAASSVHLSIANMNHDGILSARSISCPPALALPGISIQC